MAEKARLVDGDAARRQGTGTSLFAVVACASSALSAAAAAFVLLRCSDPLSFSKAYADQAEVALFQTSALALSPALLLIAASTLNGLGSREHPLGAWLCISFLLEILFKIACSLAISTFDGAVVHFHARSLEPRVIYAVQWMDWGLMSQIAALLALLPLRGSPQLTGLGPTAACRFGIVVASWASQITADHGTGLALVISACISWMLNMIDQVRRVSRQVHGSVHPGLDIFCVLSKDVLFMMYMPVMILSSRGAITSLRSQMLYTYSDTFLMLVQASFLVIRSSGGHGGFQAGRLTAPDTCMPIVCLSRDGVVHAWNTQIAAATSIKEQDAVGKALADFVAKQCREELRYALSGCSPKKSTAMELSFNNPDSDLAGAQMAMTFVSQQGSSSVMGIGQDIGQVVTSKALQERRLRFSAIVAHELRSPLSGIVGMCRAVMDTVKDELAKKHVSMILGCSSRMLELVCNITSQVSVDKASACASTPTKRERVNLLDIIDEVVTMTRVAVDKAGKPVLGSEVKLLNNTRSETLPVVYGDPYRCSQLIQNVVSNACKFTKKGYLAISAHRTMTGVDIEVSDSGCGIRPAALERIFEPFEQDSAQGLGLGLSVARGIAEEHGGRIRATSELGVGSTFTISLPGSQEEEEVEGQWDREPEPEEEEAAQDPDRCAISCPLGSEPRQHPRMTRSSTMPILTKAEEERLETTAQGNKKRASQVTFNGRGASEAKTPADRGGFTRSVRWISESADLDELDSYSLSETLRQLQWAASKEEALDEEEKPLILTVDDDEVNHMVFETSLGNYYRMVRAMSGFECLDYLRSDKERPAMILLDIMMPGMTGLEVVKEIRNTLKLGHLVLPVVLVSARFAEGCSQDETTIEAFQSGATDIFSKPFCAKVLIARMRMFRELRKHHLMSHHEANSLRNEESEAGGRSSEQLKEAQEELSRLQEEVAHIKDQADGKAAEAGRKTIEEAEEEASRQQQQQQQEEEKRAADTARQLQDAKAEVSRLQSEVAVVKAQQAELSRSNGLFEESALAALAPAAGEAALAMLRRRRGDSCTPSECSRRTEINFNRELNWLKQELYHYQAEVSDLSEKMSNITADKWHHKLRAQALEQEVSFLKSEMRFDPDMSVPTKLNSVAGL